MFTRHAPDKAAYVPQQGGLEIPSGWVAAEEALLSGFSLLCVFIFIFYIRLFCFMFPVRTLQLQIFYFYFSFFKSSINSRPRSIHEFIRDLLFISCAWFLEYTYSSLVCRFLSFFLPSSVLFIFHLDCTLYFFIPPNCASFPGASNIPTAKFLLSNFQIIFF